MKCENQNTWKTAAEGGELWTLMLCGVVVIGHDKVRGMDMGVSGRCGEVSKTTGGEAMEWRGQGVGRIT